MKPIIKKMWTCSKRRDLIYHFAQYTGAPSILMEVVCRASDHRSCKWKNEPDSSCRPITVKIEEGHDDEQA